MNKPAKLRSASPVTADGQMMYSLVRAAHVLETRLEEALEQVGLSLPKFGALSHLVKEGEPLSLSECATKMTCVRSNITQLVDRLQAAGLVRRGENPQNRRPGRGGRRDRAWQGAICRGRAAGRESASGVRRDAFRNRPGRARARAVRDQI